MNFLKKNWYWLIPLFAAVAYYAFFVYQKRKVEKQLSTDPATGQLDENTVLYQGIQGRGLEVRALQSYLNSHGGTLSVDGQFGPATAQELFKQKKVWQIALKDCK